MQSSHPVECICLWVIASAGWVPPPPLPPHPPCQVFSWVLLEPQQFHIQVLSPWNGCSAHFSSSVFLSQFSVVDNHKYPPPPHTRPFFFLPFFNCNWRHWVTGKETVDWIVDLCFTQNNGFFPFFLLQLEALGDGERNCRLNCLLTCCASLRMTKLVDRVLVPGSSDKASGQSLGTRLIWGTGICLKWPFRSLLSLSLRSNCVTS